MSEKILEIPPQCRPCPIANALDASLLAAEIHLQETRDYNLTLLDDETVLSRIEEGRQAARQIIQETLGLTSKQIEQLGYSARHTNETAIQKCRVEASLNMDDAALAFEEAQNALSNLLSSCSSDGPDVIDGPPEYPYQAILCSSRLKH